MADNVCTGKIFLRLFSLRRERERERNLLYRMYRMLRHCPIICSIAIFQIFDFLTNSNFKTTFKMWSTLNNNKLINRINFNISNFLSLRYETLNCIKYGWTKNEPEICCVKKSIKLFYKLVKIKILKKKKKKKIKTHVTIHSHSPKYFQSSPLRLIGNFPSRVWNRH